MERISELYEYKVAFVPTAQAYGTAATGGVYINASKYQSIDFVVSVGAIAATKKATIELWEADDSSGTNAAKIDNGEIAGAVVTSAKFIASVKISALRKPYLLLKIGNDLASGTLSAAAVAICRVKSNPVETIDIKA